MHCIGVELTQVTCCVDCVNVVDGWFESYIDCVNVRETKIMCYIVLVNVALGGFDNVNVGDIKNLRYGD